VTRILGHRDERGMALVTAIMVGFVASLLVSTMMYVSFHDQTSSAHNRSWGQALHVAESGVHEAIAYLQNSSGVVPSGTQSGTTPEGTFQYRIVAQARNHYQIDSVGTAGSGDSLGASRRLRVTMAPPVSFKYALFSLSDVTTKNNNVVCGDIYAGTFVEVYNNDKVYASTNSNCPSGGSIGSGNVTAATSYIQLDNNSYIQGQAWSGGYDSSGNGINNGGTIGGDAKASDSTPFCTDKDQTFYKISGGTVGGNATAWGSISSTVTGTKTQQCTAASETKSIPPFTFNAANYPSVHYYTFTSSNGWADYTAFNNYIAANKSNLSGTFYITGGDANHMVSLDGATITGDLTVVATDAPIDASSGGLGSSGTNAKVVALVSYFRNSAQCTTQGGNPLDICAIGIKNNFDMSSTSLTGNNNTSVLLYAPYGPVSFKNSADFQGAVYANNIQVKNNMNVTYDPRLEQIVGFGSSTLTIDDWQECDPGAVTTSGCG
jgi:hypothetical protein